MRYNQAAALAVELAGRGCRAQSGRLYTVAEHAVILSTYIKPALARLAIVADAILTGVMPGQLPDRFRGDILAAERQLTADQSAIAFLPPHRAAHVYLTRLMELYP